MAGLPVRGIKTVVEAIEDSGPGIRMYTLCDPDRWELPPFRPGAHIDIHLPGGLVRTYSRCNDPADNMRYVVAVKREADGRGGSIAFHDRLRAGDTLVVSLPRGGLQPDGAPHVTFVAGGIGVTPLLSAANYLARRGGDFTLYVVVRGEPPLATMLAPHRASGQAIVYDTGVSGRPPLEALIDAAPREAMLACCGPLDMLNAFERATQGWPPERVHVERFVPPPLPIDPEAKPFKLVLARSQREIEVALGESMLNALLSAGIDIPASCCGGICGACRIDWLEGTPVHRDRVLSPAERARSLMACVAGSAEERLVVDL
ncbi:PDR/VanB family oxidoreductase [Bradyrhizobium retamae]|uniref:Oxidoreductase n=1 Tax=Bradyrhizobium retamae TaxID=1300035 RepID=A0A0R3MRK8_9BRAD|nr:PDR/VanB family oxidoreductase [Bradyrhizobium retamae]KRR22364.1 oxidoreductase [Bradyrhizobium retamae]